MTPDGLPARRTAAGSAPAGRAAAEPVTAEAPRAVTRPLLVQQWRHVSFLHWTVDPERVAPLLPAGTRPDVLGGTSYVGVIPLLIRRTGPLGLPPIPYLGSFAETNVRLYSVGPDGRRGVVFRSLDAARLAPVLAARWGLRLPYAWDRMSVDRDGEVITYRSVRRWPRAPASWGHRRSGMATGTGTLLRIRIGEPIEEPSELEHFLTARWGLHAAWHFGRPLYLQNQHPRWRLHRARLLHLEEDLIQSAGLPAPTEEPVSVLYSPGTPVRFAMPQPLADA
ncbi:MAG: YqjF family protein [Micromonosporaceae bacterium]